MALHWAWSYDVQGTAADYSNADWPLISVSLTTALLQPHHPTVGYGGADYAARVEAGTASLMSPAFPKGALANGKIQLHVYASVWGTGQAILELYDVTGTNVLLSVRPASAGAVSAFNVYSQEGGALQLRGTTSGTLSNNTWHTMAVWFEPHASAGNISISLNGVVETIVVSGATGATSPWARFRVAGQDGTSYDHGQITVWDSAADTADTVDRWVALLKPTSDVSIGAFLDQAGGGTNLFQVVDEAVPSDADYATSTTALDTIKFGVTPADIDASWSPASIDGVLVVCSARGELALNSARPVMGKAASSDLLGTLHATDANSSFGVNDVFALQADATAWSVAGLSAAQPGMRTT